MNVEEFFNSLPEDEFADFEIQLRQALLSAVQRSKTAGVPTGFPLHQWIDRRMGGELLTKLDPKGHLEVSLLDGTHNGHQHEGHNESKFFDQLPEDSFAPAETALRDAIFTFLATWPSAKLATLSDLIINPAVLTCCKALLPPSIPLSVWIEKRIGGEVDLRNEGNQRDVIHLTDEARDIVTGKFHKLATTQIPYGHLAMMPGNNMMHTMPNTRLPNTNRHVEAIIHNKEQAKFARQPDGNKVSSQQGLAFISALPEDALTKEELALRHAVLLFLKAHAQPGDQRQALLHFASNDPAIAEARNAFLPKDVPLREWLDRRIGGEVRVAKDEATGQVTISLRDQTGQPKANKRKKGMTEERNAGSSSNDEASSSARERERFFNGLPSGTFTREEEELRDALLCFMENWAEEELPLISKANADPAVTKCKNTFFPEAMLSPSRIGSNDVWVANWR